MILAAVFGILPWWAWALGLVVVIAGGYALAVVPGLAVAVGKLLRAVPWPVWAALAGAIAVGVWLNHHDAQLRAAVTLERDTFWKAREDAANEAYRKNLVALNRKLEVAASAADAASRKAAAELEQERAKRRSIFDQLALERGKNVTEKAIADCRLTRGVVLQFNAGARGANGEGAAADQPAAGAVAESVDDPAGVALDSYAAAVDATHDALGTCRAQVIGWQTYHATVVRPWITSTLEAVASCIPRNP